ncbi:hypothetical protein DOTSEDRAFT_74892 [Dothistroma septosporum NZE10]|uniref:Uncharacterized protein n=1 Tax=Dothistroma septosporum (strain NZE10 / CBS 128990) TaxID=675120 RepID=N1PF95_DOTSN|nr:hypothetical protein DOTSEDRAFT_74892 [Dothistroma septosporum NZE10]
MPIFNAGGKSDEWSKTEPLPTNDAGVLRIKGLVVSTVDKIANKTNDLHEVEAMLSHLDEVEAITSTLKIDPLTLGAVLLGGAGFDDTARATPAEVNVWPKYLKQIHAEKEHPPWLNHLESNADEQERALAMFNATFHNACRHRCFFSTMDGQIGIGPIRSRPGDSVVVLQGGLFPFVLRGKQDGQSELIGYCYVHGVMDGEAVEKLDRGAVEAAIFDLI